MAPTGPCWCGVISRRRNGFKKEKEGNTMKKRFPAILLALALCFGLAVPAFAADTIQEEPLTVEGITFSEVVLTDKYENIPDFPEGFYNLGMIGFYQEDTEEYGYQTFP